LKERSPLEKFRKIDQTASWFKKNYRTRAIITRSGFETALDYKPQILGPTIKEFPCLVHKLPATLSTLQYKPQWKIG